MRVAAEFLQVFEAVEASDLKCTFGGCHFKLCNACWIDSELEAT